MDMASPHRYAEFGLRFAAIVLVVVALAKLVSAFSGVAYLRVANPVLSFFSNRVVLLLAGNVELAVALFLFARADSPHASMTLLALCATFVVYRLGLVLLQVRAPCPCLGRASDWLHLTPDQADRVALCVLLLLTGLGLLSMLVRPRAPGILAPRAQV